MAGSVRVDEKHLNMLKDMTQNDKGLKIFESYKDLVVFAAVLGYNHGIKEKINKQMGDPIKMHIFSGEYDLSIINCIALAETGDPMFLGEKKEDDKINIFEEYANAGLNLINESIYKQPGDWIEKIIALIFSIQSSDDDPLDELVNEW